MNRKFKNFCNIVNIFKVNFELFNASMLNNSIDFLQKSLIDPKILHSGVNIMNETDYQCINQTQWIMMTSYDCFPCIVFLPYRCIWTDTNSTESEIAHSNMNKLSLLIWIK